MKAIPYEFATRHKLLLVAGAVNQLLVTATTTRGAINEVMRSHGPVELRMLPKEELDSRIQDAYSNKGDAAQLVSSAQEQVDLSLLVQEVQQTQDLLSSDEDAPVVRILNLLMMEAVKAEGSDIHIEPYESKSVVRIRVDGVLREVTTMIPELHKALTSRLKIMAKLDIAESRLPQDGRISTRLGNRLIDIRVSTIPTPHGERGVLRILDKSSAKLDLEVAGMSPALIAEYDALLRKPHGLILITGPTGSGKSTTMYASLKRMDTSTTNIMTVEDPIEYELPGIAQTQVNEKIGLTFAAALRSILRQDPDVVLIGEIRDKETAEIAIRASLTGHLVLASIHTNDAPSAVTRLVEMGVEPFLVASSLLGVMGQRLVRKIDPANPGQLRGRIGVYELLTVNESITQLIKDNAPDTDIRSAAIQAGMRTMRQYGEALAAQGITTLEQVHSATP